MLNKETKLIHVDSHAPDPVAIAQATAVIQAGGLVAFPTETVYGLGADGLNETAVQAIFTAKQRPSNDPIILHVADVSWLPRVAQNIPELAYKLADHFWPGPLTLILPKADTVPTAVTANGPTVAVRCPHHSLAQALTQVADTPIGAPSANLFSHTSPTTAQHVLADLNGRIDLILDGGPADIGVESTVLDITGDVPTLLRPGGVTVEALTAVLGHNLRIKKRQIAEDSAEIIPAPGMLDRHYAPNTPLWLFSGTDKAVRHKMQTVLAEQPNPTAVALLIASEDGAYFVEHDGPICEVGSLSALPIIANNLFKSIRQLDQPATKLILARSYPEAGLGRALHDRLYRAADRRFDCT